MDFDDFDDFVKYDLLFNDDEPPRRSSIPPSDNGNGCLTTCIIVAVIVILAPYLELTIKLSTTNKTTAEIAALHPAAKIISSRNPSKNNLPRIYNEANNKRTQQHNNQIISDLHFIFASGSSADVVLWSTAFYSGIFRIFIVNIMSLHP